VIDESFIRAGKQDHPAVEADARGGFADESFTRFNASHVDAKLPAPASELFEDVIRAGNPAFLDNPDQFTLTERRTREIEAQFARSRQEPTAKPAPLATVTPTFYTTAEQAGSDERRAISEILGEPAALALINELAARPADTQRAERVHAMALAVRCLRNECALTNDKAHSLRQPPGPTTRGRGTAKVKEGGGGGG